MGKKLIPPVHSSGNRPESSSNTQQAASVIAELCKRPTANSNGNSQTGYAIKINKSGLPQLTKRPTVKATVGYDLKKADAKNTVTEITKAVLDNQSEAFKRLADM